MVFVYVGSLDACCPPTPQLDFGTSWITMCSAPAFVPICSKAPVIPLINVSFCDDIELFMKLRRMKEVSILLEPRAVVYHPHPNSLQELFAQRKWHGKGSVNFYRKYWHSTFKRNSILNTSRRYIECDIQSLALALSTDHRKLCAGCQFGKCRISEPVLPHRSLPDTKYLRQITCLAWAAGILGVRSTIDYDWGNSMANWTSSSRKRAALQIVGRPKVRART
jgi:hypothetical protein